MKFKKKALALILLICMVVSSMPMQISTALAADKSAQWIWLDGSANNAVNTWMAFRKTVEIPEAPTEPVYAKIAVDSKYWLYINGEMVIFEGQLKRGPNRTDSYFDNVDIAPYLKKGENTIAVLVWYFGKSGFSHISSGQGGLLFDAEANGFSIKSDSSWKAKKFEAYGTSSITPNYRLSEANLLYDARKEAEMIGWEIPSYDDSAWSATKEFGAEGSAPWNNLHERPVPQWKNDGLELFANDQIAKSQTAGTASIKYLPYENYVIEARISAIAGACALVFGNQDDTLKNMFMWQINVTGSTRILKPHVMNNGTWTVPASISIADVFAGAPSNQYVDMKLVINGDNIDAYVKKTTDANYPASPTYSYSTTKSKAGSFGIRAAYGETGGCKSIKVTSLDGSETYFYDDFTTGKINFSNSRVENNALIVSTSSETPALYSEVKGAWRYICTPPTNFQFTPYFKVNSEAGKVITITTNTTYHSETAAAAQYVTKDGVQAYESLGWMNGSKVYFDFPEGVEVLEVGYRHTGYDADVDGSFSSNDAFYNTLWKKSVDTLLVTMRDNYMDCPDRERAQWWGDAVNEFQEAFYSLSRSADLLTKKGMYNVLDWQRPDGVIPTVAPCSDHFELPAQVLAGIVGYYTYYEYTGDLDMLAYAYPKAVKYLKLFNVGSDGVIVHRSGSWDWADWGQNQDFKLNTNSFYYMAVDRMIKTAELIGDTTELPFLLGRKVTIEQNFDKVFWKSAGYYRTTGLGATDDRANAMAVCAGLVPESRYPQVNQVFKTSMYASPYMEKYVLEAMFKMGYEQDALARMKQRYAPMVNSEIPTLWEGWTTGGGTINHAWSGGPLTVLSMYAAGIAPIEAGFTKFGIIPQMGGLTEIDAVVPSVKGEIKVSLKESAKKMNITIPEGTTALVGIPRVVENALITANGANVWENGKVVEADGVTYVSNDAKYIYFEVSAGVWSFESSPMTIPVKDKYTLNIGSVINGSIKVNDEEVTLPYSKEFDKDAVVTVLAVAYSGYEFKGFSGTVVSSEDINLTMNKDYYLEAKFAEGGGVENKFVELTIGSNFNNDVIATVNGTSSPMPYTGYFKRGDIVTVKLTAIDEEERQFVKWVGRSETSNEINVIMSGAVALTAEFKNIAPVNLALNKTVTSTTNVLTSGTTWRVANLTDGRRDSNNGSYRGYTTNTYPSRDISATPNIIDINLGSVQEVNRVVIFPRTDATAEGGLTCNFPVNFTIEVSKDNATWSIVKTVSGLPNPNMMRQVFDFDAVDARYIRVKTTYLGIPADDEKTSEVPYRLQLAEIEVYCISNVEINLALNKPVTTINDYNVGATWRPANMTDGFRNSNGANKGYTTNTYPSRDISAAPHTIDIDLGSVMNVNRVVLFPRTDATSADGSTCNFPVDFTIEASLDNINYYVVKTVKDLPNPQFLRQVFNFDTVGARYIRIKTTYLGVPADDEKTSEVPYRLQIAEIEVYNIKTDAVSFSAIATNKGVANIVANNTNADFNATLVIAAYDAKGAMIKCHMQDVKALAGGSAMITMPINSSDYPNATFKAFVWDANNKPMFKAISGSFPN